MFFALTGFESNGIDQPYVGQQTVVVGVADPVDRQAEV